MNEKFKSSCQKYASLLLVFSYRKMARPMSRYFRGIFENNQVKLFYGLTIFAFSYLVGILPDSLASFQIWSEGNPTQIALAKIDFKTEESLQKPLDRFQLTKRFSFFHPGLDFATDAGSAVIPILPGRVEKVSRLRFGYGNHVIINHGSGLKSLYAHFSKISVEEGQDITENTIIGFIGSTGWSTGPHLHLEIQENGQKINPEALFEDYFGSKLASK